MLTHTKAKVSLPNFKPIFPLILWFFDLEYYGQTSFKVAFVMFGLFSMKFRKLKSLHWESQKNLNSIKLRFWVIHYTMGLKLFSKYFSKFLMTSSDWNLGKVYWYYLLVLDSWSILCNIVGTAKQFLFL